MPTEPIDRARARIWINFADTRLFAASGKLLYGRNPQPTAILNELTEHLLFIERQGLAQISDREPYWLGSKLSLVDLTFYPWNGHYAALETPWERTFFFLPLGHTEDLQHLEMAIELADRLAIDSSLEYRPLLEFSIRISSSVRIFRRSSSPPSRCRRAILSPTPSQ